MPGRTAGPPAPAPAPAARPSVTARAATAPPSPAPRPPSAPRPCPSRPRPGSPRAASTPARGRRAGTGWAGGTWRGGGSVTACMDGWQVGPRPRHVAGQPEAVGPAALEVGVDEHDAGVPARVGRHRGDQRPHQAPVRAGAGARCGQQPREDGEQEQVEQRVRGRHQLAGQAQLRVGRRGGHEEHPRGHGGAHGDDGRVEHRRAVAAALPGAREQEGSYRQAARSRRGTGRRTRPGTSPGRGRRSRPPTACRRRPTTRSPRAASARPRGAGGRPGRAPPKPPRARRPPRPGRGSWGRARRRRSRRGPRPRRRGGRRRHVRRWAYGHVVRAGRAVERERASVPERRTPRRTDGAPRRPPPERRAGAPAGPDGGRTLTRRDPSAVLGPLHPERPRDLARRRRSNLPAARRGGRCYRQDRWELLVRTPTVSWSDLVVDLHRCLGSMCRSC